MKLTLQACRSGFALNLFCLLGCDIIQLLLFGGIAQLESQMLLLGIAQLELQMLLLEIRKDWRQNSNVIWVF